jgi:hypothetical protein
MFKIRETAAIYIADSLCKSYIWIRENPRGQTLTEYALIFAALSIAAFAAYESIGNSIVVLGNGLNSDLTSA